MKKPESNKERNLLKGAIRRLFSRSELRREALSYSIIDHHDPNRARVTKWSKCPECKQLTPTYLMEVDHILPLIGINETLDMLTWDEVVHRLWCDISNLRAICKTCHKAKSKLENAERRKAKKERK